MGNVIEIKKLISLSGHNWICIAMGFSAVLRTLRDLGCLISISYAMDRLLTGGNTGFAFLLVVFFEFMGAPILAFDAYICQKYRIEKEKTITALLTNKLLRVNLTWLEKEKSADLLSTCTADLQKFLNWLTDVFPNFIRTVSYLFGGLMYALTQDVLLTLCVFPVVILVAPILASSTKPLRKMSDMQRKSAGGALEKAQEILVDPEFVKAYALESVMKNRVSAALVERYKSECKSGITLSFAKGLGKLMSVVPSIIAAGVGFAFLQSGAITVGFLFGFVQMASQRFGYVIPQIGDILAATTQASSSAVRINLILAAETEEERPRVDIDDNYEYTWELKNVCFEYIPGQPVLKDISMKLRKGETVAFVGVSGCGKSTLIKLLMGVYQPSSGSITCMGKPMGEWQLDALRSYMAPVFQNPQIFPASIRDNLCVKDGGFTDAEYISALEMAELSDYVKTLDNGLDEQMTQYGSTLSGGQRQRLALARTWLKNAPILIFDEATSALDSATEYSIQQTFDKIKAGKTTVMIAHRLNTITNADRVFVMENGKIVQEGTPSQLENQEGVYSRLLHMHTLKSEIYLKED